MVWFTRWVGQLYHLFKQHGYANSDKIPKFSSPQIRVSIVRDNLNANRKIPLLSRRISRVLLLMPSLSLTISFLLLGLCLIGLQAADDLPDQSGGDVCARVSDPGGCPINCFRADPVCGANGVTYWCGCPDAACHGASVVKKGACDAGNAGSASVPGQALLLIHIVWLFLLGLSLLVGVF